MKWWLLLLALAAGCTSNSSALSTDAPDPGGGHNDADVAGGRGGADVAGGRGGSDVAGGRGGSDAGAGRGGAAGGGTGGGVLTSPACQTELTHWDNQECPRIADPNMPTNPNAGWQCVKSCTDIAGAALVGCIYKGVTFCVSDCADCRL